MAKLVNVVFSHIVGCITMSIVFTAIIEIDDRWFLLFLDAIIDDLINYRLNTIHSLPNSLDSFYACERTHFTNFVVSESLFPLNIRVFNVGAGNKRQSWSIEGTDRQRSVLSEPYERYRERKRSGDVHVSQNRPSLVRQDLYQEGALIRQQPGKVGTQMSP